MPEYERSLTALRGAYASPRHGRAQGISPRSINARILSVTISIDLFMVITYTTLAYVVK